MTIIRHFFSCILLFPLTCSAANPDSSQVAYREEGGREREGMNRDGRSNQEHRDGRNGEQGMYGRHGEEGMYRKPNEGEFNRYGEGHYGGGYGGYSAPQAVPYYVPQQQPQNPQGGGPI